MNRDSIKVRKIGKYILQKPLGKGAMGSVWLSHHMGLDIPVAVKLLNMRLVEEDPEYLERFIKEGKLAGSINHKNIVRIFDAGCEKNCYYLVMEYIEGSDVLQMLEKGPLAVDHVIDLAIAIAEALNEAHKVGVIHRDIKPDNIMVTKDGDIKLADLGLAKQVDDKYSSTIVGTALGTPHYIAPEQALNAQVSDQRSDIYSLGATLYHMVTGTVPFEGDSAFGVMMMHSKNDLEPPQDRKPGLPENICTVICKMMRKDPCDRYESCEDLIEDLNKIKYSNTPAQKLKAGKAKELNTTTTRRYKLNKSLQSQAAASRLGARTGSILSTPKKQNKSKVPLFIGICAGVLIIVLIAVIASKNQDAHALNEGKQNDVVVQVDSANEVDVRKTKNSVDTVLEPPERQKGEAIDFLKRSSKEFFLKPSQESFFIKDNILQVSSDTDKFLKVIGVRKNLTNYKIVMEYKWTEEESLFGLLFHADDNDALRINLKSSGKHNRTGSVYAQKVKYTVEGQERTGYLGNKRKLEKSFGDWNSIEILCQGTTVTATLNGGECVKATNISRSEGMFFTGIRSGSIEIRKFILVELPGNNNQALK